MILLIVALALRCIPVIRGPVIGFLVWLGIVLIHAWALA